MIYSSSVLAASTAQTRNVSLQKPGFFSAELAAVAHFFDSHWDSPAADAGRNDGLSNQYAFAPNPSCALSPHDLANRINRGILRSYNFSISLIETYGNKSKSYGYQNFILELQDAYKTSR